VYVPGCLITISGCISRSIQENMKLVCWAMQAFGPLVFYDVAGKENIPEGSSSIVNLVEVEMVLCVYRELVHLHPDLRTKPSVAVISPYKAQVGVSLQPGSCE